MRFGLIGSPLGHSFSPRLHAEYGTGDYVLCPLTPAELPAFFAARDFDAVNVTIPYKQDVIPLMDEMHSSAISCGAVNTVINRGGRLTGYNTDLFGMHFALSHAGISLADKHVMVLGSGGTSHTARALALREGAASVTVVSRSGEVDYAEAAKRKETEVVINTTPVGMFPHADASPISLALFPRLQGVFDAVFNPLRTRLVQQALSLGVPVGSGLLMLAAQAKVSANLFLGGDCSFPAPDSADGKDILTDDILTLAYNPVEHELLRLGIRGLRTRTDYMLDQRRSSPTHSKKKVRMCTENPGNGNGMLFHRRIGLLAAEVVYDKVGTVYSLIILAIGSGDEIIVIVETERVDFVFGNIVSLVVTCSIDLVTRQCPGSP